jgi:transglutaminase-like putative cysteine protease
MRRGASGSLLVLALAWGTVGPAAGAETEKHFEGPYHITIAPPQRFRATVRSTQRFPNLVGGEWWAAFPLPTEFPGQPSARGRVRIAEAPAAEVGRITDESPLQQPLLVLHWFPESIDGGQSVTAEATYEVTIARRTLEPGAPTQPVPRLRPVERSTFLAATPHFDFPSRTFQAWLRRQDLRRRPGERDLDFAYRALEALVRTHTYRYEAQSDRTASAVCAAGWSDCGGLSTVYVSTLRANGIPARCLTGRWIHRDMTHVKMDFYAEGVGWVPAEPSGAVSSHSAGSGFGSEHADMLITHFDLIRINDRSHWMQGLGAVRFQNAEGSGAGMTFEHAMVVEALPADDGSPAGGAPREASRKRKPGATRRRRP